MSISYKVKQGTVVLAASVDGAAFPPVNPVSFLLSSPSGRGINITIVLPTGPLNLISNR